MEERRPELPEQREPLSPDLEVIILQMEEKEERGERELMRVEQVERVEL
jgi:hypothetical protein